MTYLPYPYGWSDYSKEYPMAVVSGGGKLCYWQWVEQYGGKVVDQELHVVKWRLEFKNDEDAVVFKLKFGK
jgi:hypothetical protein